MKYCRFVHNGNPAFGLIESVGGRDAITRTFAGSPCDAIPDEDGPSHRIQAIAVADAKLLAPVRPSKVVCVGRNYREHAKELGNEVPTEILIFFKPPSSVIAPGEQVRRPKISQRVDYEGELAVVIGTQCYKLGEDQDVREYIRGYTCLNDVTTRDLQNKDGQWTRAKGWDTFCPVGPVVTDELDPWAGVTVETRVNGQVRQHGTTTDFIFPLDQVMRYITSVMTLVPGDVIATGTPSGVGPVVAGDVIEVEIEGVGVLRNPVVDE